MDQIKQKTISFIQQLQEYFKIDLFYLIKSEFWLMLEKTITMSFAFLLALAWANWIDPSVYGNYQYILSLAAIISVFSLSGMGIAVVRGVAKGFERTFISGFKIQLKWGILTSIAALGIAAYYWTQGNKELGLPFLIIAVFLPLFNASIIYTDFLVGKKLFKIQTKYNSITQAAAVIIMISTLFCIKTFLPSAPAYIILLLIIFIYYLSRTLLRFLFFVITKIKFKPNKKDDASTITFGKHLSLLGLIDVLANNIDKILLFHYLGAINLAVYLFAILVPQQISVLLKHISTLSLPKFSVRPREEIKKSILKKTCYLAAMMGVLMLIYILFAPIIYRVFFPKYLTSVPYSQLYALSVIPLCFSVITEVLRAKMMLKQIYQVKIITPLVRAGFFLALIPLYGIWGAVIAILGARTFNALLFIYLTKKI